MNKKGQFFSPDLIVAIIVFVAGVGFFFMMSNVVFSKVSLSQERIFADETAHIIMNNLISVQGVPFNWENGSSNDTNTFGLVIKKNELKKEKILKLIDYLDDDYESTIEKLGLGPFDFQIVLYNPDGDVLLSSSQSFLGYDLRFVYDRIVIYDDELCKLRGVVALER